MKTIKLTDHNNHDHVMILSGDRMTLSMDTITTFKFNTKTDALRMLHFCEVIINGMDKRNINHNDFYDCCDYNRDMADKFTNEHD